MTGGVRATARLAVWTGGLVLAARLLLAVGSDTLSVPLTSLDDLSAWVSRTPPADMAVALLRLAALAAVAYLLAATALSVVARLVRVRGLVAAANRISPAVVRRVAAGGSGVGLVLGGAVASLPVPAVDLLPGTGPGGAAVAAAPIPSSAAMSRVPAGTATMTRTAGPTGPDAEIETEVEVDAQATMVRVEPPAPAATMTRLDPAPPPAPPTPPGPPVEAAPAAYGPERTPVAATPAAPAIDLTTWIVEPGDSLWSIAEDVMASPPGSRPGERAVGRYWQRLVQTNRPHLVDPDNPDLLVPGQQLVVPPPDG